MTLPLTDPRPDPPNRSCRVVFSGLYGAASWVNVMWLFLTGSGEITVSDLNALATALFNAYGTRLQARMSASATLTECSVTLWNSPDVIGGIHTGSVAGTGVTGVDLPASVAAVVSWAIADRYRGGHPRTYLCGLRSGQVSGVKQLETGWVAGTTTAANAFHTDVEAITGVGSGITAVEHGIVSFQHNRLWRTPPLFRRIAGASVHTRIDAQRRRLGREG